MCDFVKDPNAVLDFGFDWSDWLAAGETLTVSTWSVPSGITEESNTNSTTTTTIWLSGGTAEHEYEVTNHVTTSAGREDDRTLNIKLQER